MKTREELEGLLNRARERYNNNSIDGKPTKFGLDVLAALQDAIDMTMDIERLSKLESEMRVLEPMTAVLQDNLAMTQEALKARNLECISNLSQIQKANEEKLIAEARVKELEAALDTMDAIANE